MAFDPIDSWFEKGFRVRRQRPNAVKRDARRGGGGGSGGGGLSRRGGVKFSAGAKAKNIKSVVRRAPEVVVKITGSSNGMKHAKNHLDYISRNGKLELEDETGASIQGQEGLRGLRDQYKASQIPEEGKKREFLHVMFSMPAGTDQRAIREAVSKFCAEEFSNRRYVMVQHDDKDHSHVHVCVGTRDIDRADEARLSPRKQDLFRWRQGFADKLREEGVEAAASGRAVRFNFRRHEKAAIRQIRMENPNSPVFDRKRAADKEAMRAHRATVAPEKAFVGPLRGPRTPRVLQDLKRELDEAIKTGKRPANPAHDRIEKARSAALKDWEKVAANLEKDGDRELAAQLRELMATGQKQPLSRNQELFDAAQTKKEKAVDQSAGRKSIERERD